MAEIIPSIIAKDFSVLKEKVKRLEGLVNWIELDVLDGAFTPNVSWQNPGDLQEIDGKIKLSSHLMIEYPETVIEDWEKVVDRVIIHEEATDNLEAILDKYENSNSEIGVALKLETPLEKISSLIDRIKYVQLMSISNIGYQGQKFDERIFDKVSELKETLPGISVGVDGGIGLNEARVLSDMGVENLIVGSALWESKNLEEEIRKFKEIFK